MSSFSPLPDCFYEVTPVSIVFRLALAAVCGGIIGLERGANKHPAGFRTHILVCLGSAIAMLTNQFILEQFQSNSDPARLGAQVITGVGFLGAGTIFVTGRSKIKGLTTAAGLWASACLGLAFGIGFYSGALVGGLILFTSLALLPRLENYIYTQSRTLDIYIEIDSFVRFKNLTAEIRSRGIVVHETSLSKLNPIVTGGVGVYIAARVPKGMTHAEAVELISAYEGVCIVEEV